MCVPLGSAFIMFSFSDVKQQKINDRKQQKKMRQLLKLVNKTIIYLFINYSLGTTIKISVNFNQIGY